MARITDHQRREFLKRMGCTVCAGGAASLIPQLDLMSTALAADPEGGPPGYRALVCIYFGGGNDSFNLLIPNDAGGYARYLAARGGGQIYVGNGTPEQQASLALAQNVLRPVSPVGLPASSFGLHPQCADNVAPAGTNNAGTNHRGIEYLFNQSRLSFVANVGTLVAPISKTQYNNNSVPRPPQLYSHNDQTNLWQLGRTDPQFAQGWGGQVAAQVTTDNGPSVLSPCISIAGSNRFQIGKALTNAPIFPYQMSSGGVTQLNNYSGTSNFGNARRAALDQLLDATYAHPFATEFKAISRRALDLAGQLSTGLNTDDGRVTSPYQYTGTWNPANNQYGSAQVTVAGTNYSNGLLDQLRMVARMIKLSKAAGGGIVADKQIYYVSLGGFDSHDNQMPNNGQPLLMARLSQAMGWFDQALAEIGARDQVVTFTMSEFARTLNSNGNGSDHAWGGVQMVMGGAPLQGRRIFGTYPQLNLNANDDAGRDWSFSRGQYIPTTAMDQMAAALAQWIGVAPAQLPVIFPNLPNFASYGGILPILT